MRSLVLDIGNTRVKCSIMEGDEVLASTACEQFDGALCRWIASEVAHYGVHHSILSSTRGDAEGVESRLRAVVANVVRFDASTPVPIAVSYATPETLGRDRLAAAVGAWGVYGEGVDSLMIVDLGSAITIDTVTRSGGFEGGVISPGVAMRFRALNEFTGALPLCEPTDEVVQTPRTTQVAIEQGVMDGVAFEIDGHISRFLERSESESEKKLVIFAGGDAKKLAKRIKNTIFAERELVSLGLNRILKYNAK